MNQIEERPLKHYVELRQESGNITFVVNDNHNRFIVTMAFNDISRTYTGIRLRYFDDNFRHIERNMQWIHSMDTGNVRQVLAEQGFTQVPASNIEICCYNGTCLLGGPIHA